MKVIVPADVPRAAIGGYVRGVFDTRSTIDTHVLQVGVDGGDGGIQFTIPFPTPGTDFWAAVTDAFSLAESVKDADVNDNEEETCA